MCQNLLHGFLRLYLISKLACKRCSLYRFSVRGSESRFEGFSKDRFLCHEMFTSLSQIFHLVAVEEGDSAGLRVTHGENLSENIKRLREKGAVRCGHSVDLACSAC